MHHAAPRPLLAALISLGLFGAASEAHAAYVCEIELVVTEIPSDTGPWGQPLSFYVGLNTQPFCGGDPVGQPLFVHNQQFPAFNPTKTFDTVLTNALAEYEDTAMLGAFLQLHSAAALGLPVEIDVPNDSSISLRFEGVATSNVAGSPPPSGSSSSGNFDGYACSSQSQVHSSPGSVYASGHQLALRLTATPDCTGATIHQRTLSPQTESALPDPKKSDGAAKLSYRQARLQEFNLATVALGHAMMMAQVGKMQVRVSENSTTHRLQSVRFRATAVDACPPAAGSKPKKPLPGKGAGKTFGGGLGKGKPPAQDEPEVAGPSTGKPTLPQDDKPGVEPVPTMPKSPNSPKLPKAPK